MGLLWRCSPVGPRKGQLQEHGFPNTAVARISGLYLTIQSNAPGLDALTIARHSSVSLRSPLPGCGMMRPCSSPRTSRSSSLSSYGCERRI